MVTETPYEVHAYRCDECDMHYLDKDDAEACEAFCQENNQCSRDITARSLERRAR